MLIDWFTVSAQIINFLVLVFLLKHFLYRPITDAMDRREKGIASRLDEAEKKKETAEKEAARYRSKVDEIAEEREQMLRKAMDDANARKEELLKTASEEVERKKAAWEESIRGEKQSFLAELRKKTSTEVFAVARGALKDLASRALEKELIEGFKRHLEGMDEKEKNELRELLAKEKGITVRSAFEIADKKDLTEFLEKELLGNARVNYEVLPGLIAGIEIKGNGYKAAWDLDNYLDDMEQRMSQFIDTEMEK